MELAYGLGLRAADPTIRAKFYALWNKAIPATLFERLRHVIMGQNWEEMGDTFWLKQAVVSAVELVLFNKAVLAFLSGRHPDPAVPQGWDDVSCLVEQELLCSSDRCLMGV